MVKADLDERQALERDRRAAEAAARRTTTARNARNAPAPFQFAPFAAGNVQGGVAVIGGAMPPEMARQLFGHDADPAVMNDMFHQMANAFGDMPDVEHVMHQMNEMFGGVGDFEAADQDEEDDDENEDDEDEDDDEMPDLINPMDLQQPDDDDDDDDDEFIDDDGASVD
jgi:hypothetical protein